MNFNLAKYRAKKGSVLVTTLCLVAVAAIIMASYLLLVQNQTESVTRSQSWNTLVPVAEAGLEEGLALVNNGAPNIITSPWAWTNIVTTNGWSSFTNSQTSLTRYVSGSNYYTVTVNISSGTTGSPLITSIGYSPYSSYLASGPQPFLAQINQSSSSTGVTIARKIQIQTALNPLFSAAIVTKSNFDMNGNNTTVNSFDSSNPLYSTGGQYDPAKFEANGNVATDSAIVGDVSLGNGNIYGKVMTGPGTAQNAVQIGPNGSVGSTTWSSGIEPGYWSGDFNMNIPDVSSPSTTGWSTTLPAPVGGVITLNGGNYVVPSTYGTLGDSLVVTGNTTLWVQGGYTPAGLTVASTNGANLKLYVGTATGSGDSMSLGGNQALNSPGYAANFQVYGLPSLTGISMHGNAAFCGTIYAPEAAVTCGGGGNNTTDSSGSIIAMSVTLSGHWNFHYDQNLAVNGPSRGWIASGWTELKYP